ncbi:CMP-N-acetylneuraminate-poly-alpha-2,8-sialyltransferase-like [Ptychodera flava]|uniref:CMP-N-acetylneuraminate-poly-alpha-2, 8-sialyltransferase-like n=1 Tax=Ptychodera flava TaxID=63121 RepID=UPI00396A45CB
MGNSCPRISNSLTIYRMPFIVTTKQMLAIFCFCLLVYIGVVLQYEHTQTVHCECWDRNKREYGWIPSSGNSTEDKKKGNSAFEELKTVYYSLTEPWNLNVNRSREVQRKLINSTHPENLLFLTQDTTHLGELKKYTREESLSFIVSEDLYRHLPKTKPINFSRVKKCSIVGNSGILKNSHCGTNIDKSDMIFRCNLQELKAYAVDAGRLSHFATMNHGIVWNRYNRLIDKSDIKRFISDATEFSGIIAIPLGGPRSITMGIRAMKAMNSNHRVKFVFFNPEHFLSHRAFWNHNVTSIMTTGMYLTSLAMTLCEEIHLYGFWPFAFDAQGRGIPFHYTEDIEAGRATHDMPEEFKLLIDLHKQGLIHVHVGPCR